MSVSTVQHCQTVICLSLSDLPPRMQIDRPAHKSTPLTLRWKLTKIFDLMQVYMVGWHRRHKMMKWERVVMQQCSCCVESFITDVLIWGTVCLVVDTHTSYPSALSAATFNSSKSKCYTDTVCDVRLCMCNRWLCTPMVVEHGIEYSVPSVSVYVHIFQTKWLKIFWPNLVGSYGHGTVCDQTRACSSFVTFQARPNVTFFFCHTADLLLSTQTVSRRLRWAVQQF